MTGRPSQARPLNWGLRRALLAEQLEARWYLSGDPIVQVNTNGYGSFQLDLRPDVAPQTVANFLSYVDSGKYTNLVVSRSIPGFIIQAGGITSPTATYTSNSQFVPVPQSAEIKNEYQLPNTAYTISMARQGGNANSASDEWFINLADNTTTLAPGTSTDGFGYTVFGQVVGTSGQQVVNNIATVPTKNKGSVQTGPGSSTDLQNLPLTASSQLVQITSMTLLDGVIGNVFNDPNGNGQQDTGEAGVAGRTVFVDVDGTGQLNNNPSAVTDANGNYFIAGVTPGSFKVREVLASGVHSSTALQTVTFATDQAASHVNFGEGPDIAGTVFTDLNNDATFNSGDPGVAGRTVFLNNDGSGQPGPNNPSTTTDANGHFTFSGLAAGTYNVAEVVPANVSVSTNTQAVVVPATGPTAVANVGELPSIFGTVFNDLNVNGKFDTAEPGVAGVTVFLNNDSTGKPDTNNPSTTTDANGRFAFTGLTPGSYSVQQVIPANHGVTQTRAGTTVTVGSSQPLAVNIGDVFTSTIAPFPVAMNTATPSSDANTAFIDSLYFTLLGRHVDTASLTFWHQKLAGGATHASVAQGVWDSSEHRGDEVQQYYQTFLGRAAEPTGMNYWINTFHSWGTEKVLALNFVTVPEYQHLHVSDTDYVTALYNDIALRPADSAGVTFWTNALSSGQTRLQVAQAFINGQEASTRLVDSFYADFLHRATDPTSQATVTNLEQDKVSVESAAVSVLASDEYFTLVGKGG